MITRRKRGRLTLAFSWHGQLMFAVDRARVTDSRFIALVNKSVTVLLGLSSRLFGKPLSSLQMVSVSMNLSYVGSLLISLPFALYKAVHTKAGNLASQTILSVLAIVVGILCMTRKRLP
jgi:hypothetical protein